MQHPEIRIYNSLSKRVEPLTPTPGKPLRVFVCGPTVYDYIHIGNARTFVIFDTFVKFLRQTWPETQYIQNITDIDDKIIIKATQENRDPLELSRHFTKEFKKDMALIGITAPNQYASATDHITHVIQQVNKLIERGNAYLIEGDGYYFDLTTFPEYGKLSRRTMQMADDGVSRIDDNPRKRNRGDFCLWKFSHNNEPSWQTDFGAGRPGWHIEDTAITEYYFGPQYDIHGGGQDLMFPHHEAEIAQQEAASGMVPFVRYWMHAAFLVNKEEKMSKSKGNFTALHELLQIQNPQTIRYYFLSSHYRSPLDYSDNLLQSAASATARIGNSYAELIKFQPETDIESPIDTDRHITNCQKALRDDFNTPKAFGHFFDLIHGVNRSIAEKTLSLKEKTSTLDFLKKMDEIFGIIPKTQDIPNEVQELMNKRQEAKDAKDFSKSDELRKEIELRGFEIRDTENGPIAVKK